MTRPRILRLLRVAMSVVFGTLCLALIALWVRSNWWHDSARCPLSRLLGGQPISKLAVPPVDSRQSIHASQLLILVSVEGRMSVLAGGQDLSRPGWYPSRWGVESTYVDDLWPYRRVSPSWGNDPNATGRINIRFPHWFPVALTAILAAIPWLPWSKRFSLRTLLLATTLVAVVLGLIAAMR